MVFLWVTFDKLEDIPAAIAERISVKIGDYPEALSVMTPPTSVNKNPVVVISSPLVGAGLGGCQRAVEHFGCIAAR